MSEAAKMGSTANKSFENASASIGSATDSAKDFAGKTLSNAKEAVSSVASDVGSGFQKSIEEHKNTGAEAIANVARSAREAAKGYEDQAPQIAGAVGSAATAVEKMSTDLKDKTFGEIVDSMSGFAQRQPIAFLGCGVVAGLILARFLSAPNRS
jgi:hypothetical protein